MEELEEVIRSTGEEAHIRLLLDRPPLSCAADPKIVTSLREAVASVTGQMPEVAGVGLPDYFTLELWELVRRASQDGDEEKLFALTKRINELLREQEQERNRRRRNDAA